MTTAREDAQQEAQAKADFKPKLVLEGGTLHTFSPIKGRAGIGGEETEEPMVTLSIRVPVDTTVRYMGLITRLWRKKAAITLGLMFTEPAEQLKTGITATSQNGAGPAPTGLEAKAKEEQSVASARALVANLPGVSTATFSGQHTGFTDLAKAEEAPAVEGSTET